LESTACRGARRFDNGVTALMFLRRHEGDEWPQLSDAGLAATAAGWLASALDGKTALADLRAENLSEALHAMLPWKLKQRLDDEAPTHFAAPSGSVVPIDYEAEEGPKLSIRVQECLGLRAIPPWRGVGGAAWRLSSNCSRRRIGPCR